MKFITDYLLRVLATSSNTKEYHYNLQHLTYTFYANICFNNPIPNVQQINQSLRKSDHIVVRRCYNLSGLLAPLALPKETSEMIKKKEDNSPSKKGQPLTDADQYLSWWKEFSLTL